MIIQTIEDESSAILIINMQTFSSSSFLNVNISLYILSCGQNNTFKDLSKALGSIDQHISPFPDILWTKKLINQ